MSDVDTFFQPHRNFRTKSALPQAASTPVMPLLSGSSESLCTLCSAICDSSKEYITAFDNMDLFMNWQNQISIDPEILMRKPVIKGTRLAVVFIIDLLANGWSEADIIKNYPKLTHDDIQACICYASSLIKSERIEPDRISLRQL
ncbi:MAG: DUF433 domain-containing protein [Methanothrix sp.]|nr:DUF433 domain-containing protein [Methanothrix sp.]